MAQIIDQVAPTDIQRIPATLSTPGEWEVLNILSCVDCIDREQSVIQYFPTDHPENPGKPRGIKKLAINAEAVGDHHIFRLHDWMVVEIVSERLKLKLEESAIRGIEYWPVTY